MDRKKIYIAIIVVCFGATGVILYFNFRSAPASPPAPAVLNQVSTGTDTTTAPRPAISSIPGSMVYPAPTVFPNDSKFDWSLLQNSKFQSLTLDPVITLDPSEVGRDDPFKPF